MLFEISFVLVIRAPARASSPPPSPPSEGTQKAGSVAGFELAWGSEMQIPKAEKLELELSSFAPG